MSIISGIFFFSFLVGAKIISVKSFTIIIPLSAYFLVIYFSIPYPFDFLPPSWITDVYLFLLFYIFFFFIEFVLIFFLCLSSEGHFIHSITYSLTKFSLFLLSNSPPPDLTLSTLSFLFASFRCSVPVLLFYCFILLTLFSSHIYCIFFSFSFFFVTFVVSSFNS